MLTLDVLIRLKEDGYMIKTNLQGKSCDFSGLHCQVLIYIKIVICALRSLRLKNSALYLFLKLRQDLDEFEFQSIAREVKEFGEKPFFLSTLY